MAMQNLTSGVCYLAFLRNSLIMLITTLSLDGLKSFMFIERVRSMTMMIALKVCTSIRWFFGSISIGFYYLFSSN
jgi:hypothetical protein